MKVNVQQGQGGQQVANVMNGVQNLGSRSGEFCVYSLVLSRHQGQRDGYISQDSCNLEPAKGCSVMNLILQFQFNAEDCSVQSP